MTNFSVTPAAEMTTAVQEKAIKEFHSEVEHWLNCMVQYDALGNVLLFKRVDGALQVSTSASAESLSLADILACEMVVMDGGNSHGDMWKVIVHPGQHKCLYINENPLPTNNGAPAIEVSLDGGQTYIPANQGVRVMYRDLPVDGEEQLGDVHINLTTEGLITDVWVTREGEDHNIGTECKTIDDIVSNLVEANS